MIMANAAARAMRCREIAAEDLAALADLLARGFPDRPKAYWTRALNVLAQRDAPQAYPRFGFLLERDGRPVGVILTIFSTAPGTGSPARCNISSWCVDPEVRAGGYASALIASALRFKDVTYINVSPAQHTWRIIEAQGFRRYCEGQMLCAPALGGFFVKAKAARFDAAAAYGPSLTPPEREILAAHKALGCLSFVVRDGDRAHPFVFQRRRAAQGLIAMAQLVYCREIAEFANYSGALGRALAARGYFLVSFDATGAAPGLFGLFRRDKGPKYFKGPERPRLGDLAFCETVLFGP